MQRLIAGVLVVLGLELSSAAAVQAQAAIDRLGTFNFPNTRDSQPNYPNSARVYSNGAIRSPRGQVASPAATIRHSDGSTSFYYRDGTQIRVDKKAISPVGTPLRSSVINEGMRR
ncbi:MULTISPECIES: hypothetical protein [Trichocoleus]|uniref:Uncharacterized protein n=1 Tax=Trichocoleus desertorum GB2-A4 TaxID=2933944 RepID=A0ABV0JCB0_9CYAN|nr:MULTISPECIES: hypothetical protein [unclassified Trichocoleus]MBD1864064.1 hypothetical protein [Trichocoleus sp. FACHB-46]MBD2093991.1 hypothetical protein [Trichocoleus sp. FACHB-591]MBD2122282.1 hypothetical protein [Trichocoleus sp. FACHB-262]